MASLTTTDPAATLPVSRTSAATLLKADARGRVRATPEPGQQWLLIDPADADARGRVRATPERRAAILAEFERSGVSAAQFARLAGIKYSTFAQWVQKHRRQRPARKPAGRALRLLEAIVAPHAKSPARADEPLRLHLPGGASFELSAPEQVPLAVSFIQALAARC